MQEEGCRDGESDGDGGAVREGVFGRRQSVGNGDRGESEDEESHGVREEARGIGWEVEENFDREGIWGGIAGHWDRRPSI